MFWLTKILGWLAAPSTLLVILLVLGAGLHLRGHQLGGRLMAGCALIWLAISVLPISALLLAPLENRYPNAKAPDRVDGILLLGGIVRSELTLAHGAVSLSDRADRLTEFLVLARRYPTAKLVFTGGFGGVGVERPEAEDIKRLITDLGLDPARVIFEDASRTTYENAILAKPLAAPKPGENWLLVTSAWHMPRSMAVFSAADWPMIPWPVDRRSLPRLGFDPAGRLQQMDIAIKEYEGLIAYRLTGRTQRFWP